MIEYIEQGQLIIEVWGSQKEVPRSTPAAKGAKATGKSGAAAQAKSTKELMAAEKAKVML